MNRHLSIWKRVLKESLSLNTVIAAAGLAYFTLFSFFPLILLIIAIASRWFDPLWVESEIITRLDFVIPGISQLLGSNLEKIVKARRSVTTTALLMLVWSGSTLFTMLARTLDSIWNGTDTRPGIRYRGLALLFVIALSLVALPLLFIGTWVTPLLKSLLPYKELFFHPNVSLLLSLLFSILLFGLLYRFLPHASPTLRDVWIGAVVAGFLWEVAKKLFVTNTARLLSNSNLIYGSLSTIIAFLLWVHFSGLIFFFGAYLAKEYSEANAEVEKTPLLAKESIEDHS